MLTMLLGGLWHGASWNFVVWGGLHGSFLAIERFGAARLGYLELGQKPGGKLIMGALTFLAVCVTWVFFRASDFDTSERLISSMFGFAPDDADTPLPTLYIMEVCIIMSLLLFAHWKMRNTTLEEAVSGLPTWIVTGALAFMTFAIIVTQGTGNAFIYFQFRTVRQ